MVVVSGSIVLDRNVEEVWSFVNDLKELPRWAQYVKRAVWVTSKKNDDKPTKGVGGKFKQTQREGLKDVVYDGEVLEHAEPTHRKTVVRHGLYEVYATFDLEAVEIVTFEPGQPKIEMCKLTLTVDVPSRTWLQWFLAPVTWLLSQFTMPAQLNTLKNAVVTYKND